MPGLSPEMLPVPASSWQRRDVKQRLALPKRTPLLLPLRALGVPLPSSWKVSPALTPGQLWDQPSPYKSPFCRAPEPCLHSQGQPRTNHSWRQTTAKDKPQPSPFCLCWGQLCQIWGGQGEQQRPINAFATHPSKAPEKAESSGWQDGLCVLCCPQTPSPPCKSLAAPRGTAQPGQD